MDKSRYNRIKSVLAEKSVTNKELAQKVGKTEHAVSRWSTNDQQPSLPMLYKIANALHVDVRELLVPNDLSSLPEKRS